MNKGIPFQHVHFIINPAAGGNQPILNTINDVLHEYDARWTVSVTHALGDGAEQARAAIEKGADLIVSYGGDGTLFDVANGVIDSDVPLGILAGGTGNAFASEFGIPEDLESAVRLLCEGHRIAAVDIAEIGDHYELLRAVVGVKVTEGASREMKDSFGPLAYVITLAERFSEDDEPVKFHLIIDGEETEAEGIACIVINSGSTGLGQLNIPDAANPTDGILDVFIINNALIDSVKLLMTQQPETDPHLPYWPAKTITVKAESAQDVWIGGDDLKLETPITIEVVPGGLSLIVPESVPEDEG
jgi:YegS/Rv2252/BmrU family lipid kinase